MIVLALFALLASACGGRSGLESTGQASAAGPAVTRGGTSAGGQNAQGGTAGSFGGSLSRAGMSALGGSGTYDTRDPRGSACVESMCTSGGWCWLNPLPQGNSLFDVVVHDSEFWAIGEDGLVLRGDGEHWLRCPTPTTESLRGSWFAPDGTLWVVGTGGAVLSFDGVVWTVHHAEPGLFLNDVHGTGSSDVWVVGDDVALHFDGTHWERHVLQTKAAINCVWARDAHDVWVGGSEVWHFDGSSWRVVASLQSDARGIWGDEKYTVWLAADDVVQCDRLGCQSTPTLTSAQFDVWGTGANDVWSIGAAGGMHWDGSRWTAIEVPTSLTSAAGGEPYGLVAVGHFGRMYRHDGKEWVNLRRAIGSVWTDVWGTADDDIWISGNSVAHFDGQVLSLAAAPTNGGLQSVHGSSRDDVWFAGCGGALLHWTHQLWTDYSLKGWSDEQCFLAVWMESPNSAWAVGSAGLAYHWDGSVWDQLPSLPAAVDSRALYGAGGHVFAADDSGSLAVWSEPDWYPIARFAGTRINAMWAAPGNELWLVGEDPNGGSLAYWMDGTSNQERVAATKLTDVWAGSPRDVWVTGDGRVFHSDGGALVEQPSGVNMSKSNIWVSPTGARWMVGGNGILRHAP